MKSLSVAFFILAAAAIATLSATNIFSTETILPEKLSITAIDTGTTTTSIDISTSTQEMVLPEASVTVKLKAFGKNDHGQTTGSLSDANMQKDISLTLPGKLEMLAAGKSHSLALTENGFVYSWGLNDTGQLGRKTSSVNETKPGIIPHLKHIVQIASTYNHSLALSSTGKVYAWGQNHTGQIGNGTRINAVIPVEITGLPEIVAIAAGHKFSLALTKNGDVYAWGGSCTTNNKEKALSLLERVGGQLTSLSGGYFDSSSTGDSRYDPVQDCLNEDAVNIKSPQPIKLPITKVKAMSAGYGHALLLQNDGTVIGMGCNTFGQAGRTPGERKGELVVIAGLPPIVQVAAGSRHSLLLDQQGKIYAIGANAAGQLGDRSRIDKSTPVHVADLPKVEKIYAGYDYSLAVTESGSMKMWGNNTDEFFIKSQPMRIDFPLQLFDKAPKLTGTGGAHVIFSF